MELVLREDRDGISVLTLNRPEKLNALSPDLLRQLLEHLTSLAESDLRCVVLHGSGRSFCAGADLEEVKKPGDRPKVSIGRQVVEAMETLPMPVIAAIHGHCYTGGLELIMGADMIVAAEDAVIRDTHATWGAVPGWGLTARLPRRIGQSFAREIMFTCRKVPAAEAFQMGLVNRVVPRDALMDTAMGMAREVAANVPMAICADRKILSEAADMSLAEALAHETANLPPRREIRAHLQDYWPDKA
ncbi:enoyl-CoA hydratase/isomerase family protein [Frigidibacter albus]|uniref:Enoyl-CoA hydratase/isomerase family protein n=1 Tax=Frigidibacter albus TaxID=1465486 RepID=A0A6L8VL36_9RHOB|nr:enoyl-CoA hydratase/isomerase family protein [Frigidibacter albus]MZQ91075.1 enoyl-CoA hydratase/isomerase family protein [Frigidibacter albus]NBE32960.1 enoyl-CoA hydratase/isomerase family protein [Frigidibacter albus]GGH62670.1 crotonase [Frigidibacter albus]